MTDQKYNSLNLNKLTGFLPGRRAPGKKVLNMKVCLAMLLKIHVVKMSLFGLATILMKKK